MDIVKTANDWAKAEVVSSMFFMLFGIAYLLTAIVFWQLGNTALTNALIIPTLIAGGLLFITIKLVKANKKTLY